MPEETVGRGRGSLRRALEARDRDGVSSDSNGPRRLAIYGRNSKPPRGWKPTRPGEEPPGSWIWQRERLRAWAHAHDYEIVLEDFDPVAKGRNPNRPAWDRVLAAARGHHVHAIAATRLDRIMRGVAHFYKVSEELQNLNVELIILDPSLHLRGRRDPFTSALVGNLAIAAQLEDDLNFERMVDVMRIGDDGRIYGPRSDRPAGRPTQYGPEHKFRRRGNRLEHHRAKCRACRSQGGEKGPPASL